VSPLRLAIVGCTGRMGQALIRLAASDPGMRIVAAVTAASDPRIGQDAGCAAGLDALDVAITTEIGCACDAVLEFTVAAGCEAWARWCAAQCVPLVSGTTGLSTQQEAAVRAAAAGIPIVWAPNMSVGINLLLGMVAELAAKLDATWDVEICETHHRRKIDAPSGTARALLDAVCRARGQSADHTAVFGRQGDCGPRPAGQVGVHAVRMGTIVGEHEVHFTSDNESLTLRHRAFSRDTFAAGALLAACWLQGRTPGLYTMRDVLFA
jgi:4-hydroxy-tetrahydrodipicolinate reductase